MSRPSSPALDLVLGVPHQVLDHGFVRVVDYMGDDAAVVQAARVSYGEGTLTPSTDASLINYLMRHWHTSPFEMCEIKLHVKLPIFVARQWIRHRTASINEVSARYSIMKDEFYLPEPTVMAKQSATNKQGRGEPLTAGIANAVRDLMVDRAEQSFEDYAWMLDERVGLSRELSRIGLPLSTYTEFYWKVNLHNLFHFLRLRADPHAQHEIRVYAHVILDLLHQWVPVSHAAFLEHRLWAVTFSASAMAALRRAIDGPYDGPAHVLTESLSLPKRERTDFLAALGVADE